MYTHGLVIIVSTKRRYGGFAKAVGLRVLTTPHGLGYAATVNLTRGMLIAPASMRCFGEIATGVTASLITRAADVVLKERRPLVLMVRETPLNLIHLRNMATITEAGGTIFPPVPAFYSRPKTIEEIIDHTVGRALDQFHIHTDMFRRWDGDLRRAVAANEEL
jgi:4-hydroxy-3-polyprenylbenzoate decarboxylase